VFALLLPLLLMMLLLPDGWQQKRNTHVARCCSRNVGSLEEAVLPQLSQATSISARRIASLPALKISARDPDLLSTRHIN
jgi:hypothetical protein